MTRNGLIQRPLVWVGAGLLCSILWASAPAAIKTAYRALSIGSDDIPSMLLFAGIRFALGGLLTLLFFSAKTRSLPRLPRALWFRVLWLGLVQTTIHYAFYFVGAARTSGTHMVIISSMQSFIMVILAHFVDRYDRLSRRKGVAILCGVTGIVLLNVGQGGDGATFAGDALIFVATLMATLATFIIRKIVRELDPFRLTGWQLLFGGTTLIAAGIGFGGKITFTFQGVWLIVYLAAVSAIAFSLWSVLLEHHPITRVGIFNSLIPVFGTLLAGIFLAENIWRFQTILAMLLVSFGVYLITSHKRAPLPDPRVDIEAS